MFCYVFIGGPRTALARSGSSKPAGRIGSNQRLLMKAKKKGGKRFEQLLYNVHNSVTQSPRFL